MEKIINFIQSVNVEYLKKYAKIIIIILFFQITGSLLARVILKGLHKLLKIDEKTTESGYYKPLKWFFYVLGFYISIYVLGTTAGVKKVADKLFRVITIFLFAKGSADSLTPKSFIFKVLSKNDDSDKRESVNLLLCKILKVFIYIVAGFIIITEFGYDLTGLAAGLGIGSAVIALAAQDVVKSLIGGFTILTDKPFIIGDYIEVGTYTGTVVDITFRSTRIKAVNNSIITIPNSLIVSEYITNWNSLDSRIIEVTFKISLKSTSQQLNRCISKLSTVLKTNENIKQDTVQVHCSSIGSDSISIYVKCYTTIIDYDNYMSFKDKLFGEMLDVLAIENIELVYPTQTIYTDFKANSNKNINDISSVNASANTNVIANNSDNNINTNNK